MDMRWRAADTRWRAADMRWPLADIAAMNIGGLAAATIVQSVDAGDEISAGHLRVRGAGPQRARHHEQGS